MDHRKITRSAAVFGLATLASRILGLVRDMSTAQVFGTSFAMSAFTISFTVPNLFRRIFGEGALTGAFVPVFTEELEKKGKEKAMSLAVEMVSLMSVVLGLITVAIIVLIGVLRLVLPLSNQASLIFSLTQWMFPYVIFICLAALFMGILNSLSHFAVPALSPCILNLSIIFAVWWICPHISGGLDVKIYGLAAGVLIGGFLQFAAHFPVLKKKGMPFSFKFNITDPLVKKIFVMMIPGVLGLSINQLNVLVDRFLSYMIGESAAAVLFYSDRLVEFPLGIFGIAFASAVLPALSLHAAKKDIHSFKNALGYSLRQVFFITIPATVGLIVMAKPIVALVFQRGEFTAASTTATAWCLIYYAIGLSAYTGVKIVVPSFYALKDMKTPVINGFFCLLLNLCLNLILMWPMRERGLALSTSISSIVNLTTLVVRLEKKVGTLNIRELTSSFFRIAFLSLLSGGLAWLSWWKLTAMLGSKTLHAQAAATLGGVSVAVLCYIAMAALFKIPELHEFRHAFSRRSKTLPEATPSEDAPLRGE